MKKPLGGINHGVQTIALIIASLALMLIMPAAWADNFAQLKGYWQCQEDGGSATLEFMSRQQLLYNGQAFRYRFLVMNWNINRKIKKDYKKLEWQRNRFISLPIVWCRKATS